MKRTPDPRAHLLGLSRSNAIMLVSDLGPGFYARQWSWQARFCRRRLVRMMRGALTENVPDPSVSQLQTYLSDNFERFTTPESVSHFGHVHYRRNRYEAVIDIVAIEGAWKIRGIEVLDERRLL